METMRQYKDYFSDGERAYSTSRYFIADGEVYDIDDAAQVMDDDLREKLHEELSPCTAQKFANRYDAAVSPAGLSWEWLAKVAPTSRCTMPDQRAQAIKRLRIKRSALDAVLATTSGMSEVSVGLLKLKARFAQVGILIDGLTALDTPEVPEDLASYIVEVCE